MATPDWLTTKFIERVLRHANTDNSISVSHIEVNMATSLGDNNNSNMYRVLFNLTCREGKTVAEKNSVVIKVAHSNQQLQKELISYLDIFDVEINMMTKVLKDMEFILKDTKLSGKCYYFQLTDPEVLVLEDLASLGFRVANRQAGLDLNHCTLVVQNLAKFHASSILLCENKPTIKNFCSKGIYSENCPPTLYQLFTSGIKALVKSAQSWPELSKQCIKKLENLQDSAFLITYQLLKLKEENFNVINHGDVWITNLMFKYDTKGNVIDQMFVDFQGSFYGTPALDLQYFFHTSPNEEVMLNHKNYLVEEYHKTLSSTMKRINCKTCIPTLEYIKKMLLETEFFGFVIAAACLPIMIASKDHAKVLDDMLEDDEFNAAAYNSEKYKVRMVKMLKKWDDMGVFNIEKL